MSNKTPYPVTKQHMIDLAELGQIIATPTQSKGWTVTFYMHNIFPDLEIICAQQEEAEELVERVFKDWKDFHNI